MSNCLKKEVFLSVCIDADQDLWSYTHFVHMYIFKSWFISVFAFLHVRKTKSCTVSRKQTWLDIDFDIHIGIGASWSWEYKNQLFFPNSDRAQFKSIFILVFALLYDVKNIIAFFSRITTLLDIQIIFYIDIRAAT